MKSFESHVSIKMFEKILYFKPKYTCLKSTLETPEQCVKYIQSSEGYLEPS